MTALPPPGNIEFCSVGADFVVLSWDVPEGQDEQIKHFIVTWSDERSKERRMLRGTNKAMISGLRPGNEYLFKVAAVGKGGRQSGYVSDYVRTAIPAPDSLILIERDARSLTITWNKPQELEKIPHHYLISSTCPEEERFSTKSLMKTFSNLEPGNHYTIKVYTVLENGEQSKPIMKNFRTICTVKKRPWEEVYQDEEEEDDDDEGKEHDYGDGDTEEQASQDYSSELSYSP